MEDGKFKNNNYTLKFGLKEVKIINDNLDCNISELVRLTDLSESTIRRIIFAINNGDLKEYLSHPLPKEHLTNSSNKDTIHIHDGVYINIYNNGRIEDKSVEEQKKVSKMRLKAWAKQIKKRGGYICAKCGKVDTEHSQAHHIFPKSTYPSLACDVGNGIVLCQKCHTEYHKQYQGKENAYNFIGWLHE